jgi:hypothetical protein
VSITPTVAAGHRLARKSPLRTAHMAAAQVPGSAVPVTGVHGQDVSGAQLRQMMVGDFTACDTALLNTFFTG